MQAGATLVHERGGNMMFAEYARRGHDALRAAGAMYYDWPGAHPAAGSPDDILQGRLVTSWSTTEAQVDEFVERLAAAR